MIIQFNRHTDRLTVTVEDNGKGFNINDTPATTSAGISTIRNRVNYLNAAIDLLATNEYDLILLDINLPDIDGITLCDTIRKSGNSIKIIGLTSSNEAGIISRFLRAGGNGYLLKNMDRNELLEAITKVRNGKIHLSDSASEKLLEQYTSINEVTNGTPVLTRREKEILELLDEGLSGPQIAKKLFISPYTVETHRKNLLQKFGAGTSQLLIRRAREYKLIG